MLTAEEFNLRPQPRQWFRPEAVTIVSEPMDDEAEESISEPVLEAGENTERLVRETCLELKRGITTNLIARLVGCRHKAASTYLSRMQDRGMLEVVARVKNGGGAGGRPSKIYRVKE